MKRNVYVWSVRILMWLAAAVTAALTLFLVGYVLIQGIPNLSWEFISTKPSFLKGTIGILPDILNTIYIVIATLVFVLIVIATLATVWIPGARLLRVCRIFVQSLLASNEVQCQEADQYGVYQLSEYFHVSLCDNLSITNC